MAEDTRYDVGTSGFESMDSATELNEKRMMDSAVMESVGTIEAYCPNYEEGDDVMDSIAAGYF